MSVSFPKPLTEKEEKFYIKQYEQGDAQATSYSHRTQSSPGRTCREKICDPAADAGRLYLHRHHRPDQSRQYISQQPQSKACHLCRTLHRKRNPDEHTSIAARLHIRGVSSMLPIGTDKDGNEISLNDILGHRSRCRSSTSIHDQDTGYSDMLHAIQAAR